MAPASSASSSDGDEKVQYLATSLSGLPVRVPGQQDGLENGKGEPKGLKDTLDLAVRPFAAAAHLIHPPPRALLARRRPTRSSRLVSPRSSGADQLDTSADETDQLAEPGRRRSRELPVPFPFPQLVPSSPTRHPRPSPSSSISLALPARGPLADTAPMGVPINPDRPIEQKLEQKRLEHEKQRAAQKKAFEEQVRSDAPGMDFEHEGFRGNARAGSGRERRIIGG